MSAPQGKKPGRFRRQYFVKKAYQSRFMAPLCGLCMVMAGVAGVLVYVVVKRDLEEAMYSSHLPTRDLWQLIRSSLAWSNAIMAGVSVLFAVVAVVLVIRHSRRAIRVIEGEILAIDDAGEFGSNGKAGALWQGTAEQAAIQVRERMRPFRECAESLEASAQELERALASGAREKVPAIAKEIRGVVDVIEKYSEMPHPSS